MKKDPYKILGIDREAENEVIKAAFHALAKKYHPDKNCSPEAVTLMKEINEAFHQIMAERNNPDLNDSANIRTDKSIRNITKIAVWESQFPSNSVIFNHDGTILASGHGYKDIFSYSDNLIKLYSTSSKHVIREFQQGSWVKSIAFNNCGSLLASGHTYDYIKVWSAATGEIVKSISIRKSFWSEPYCWSICFHPHQDIIAVGANDKNVRLYDIASGKTPLSLAGHGSEIYSVAFSPDGNKLASGSIDKTIGIWDIQTGQAKFLLGHSGAVRSVAFSPDSSFVASGSSDNTIRIWSTSYCREIRALLGHADKVNSVAFSHDGRILASGSLDKTVKLWTIDTGENTHTIADHTECVNSVAFSPDGKFFASGSESGAVVLYKID
jgi:WD40 repeat protein